MIFCADATFEQFAFQASNRTQKAASANPAGTHQPARGASTLTFVVDSAVLVGVGQLQHLVQLVLCHVLADHVHGRFELVARDVPVAVAVKYPKVRI